MLQTISWWIPLWFQYLQFLSSTNKVENEQTTCDLRCRKKPLCDTCVKPYHILSNICSFPSLLILTCAGSLVYIYIYIYIRVCVLNSRLAALFLPCGWIFLRANPKSFAFILDMIYSVCCAFLNHKRITKEQKTCIFSKNACILFGCQKITLVDNLPV